MSYEPGTNIFKNTTLELNLTYFITYKILNNKEKSSFEYYYCYKYVVDSIYNKIANIDNFFIF